MNMIRLLRADEIECRVSTISEKGLSLLLYKDARVDQRILDETFIPLGWQRTHQSIEYNDQREISALVIANSWNKVVYSWIAPRAAAQKQGENGLSQSQMSNLQKELARTGVALEAVLERYHLNRPEDMDPDTYKQAMSSLKKTQTRNNSAA